jgi:hypothetical protein
MSAQRTIHIAAALRLATLKSEGHRLKEAKENR